MFVDKELKKKLFSSNTFIVLEGKNVEKIDPKILAQFFIVNYEF